MNSKICQECGSQFTSQLKLNQHLKVHDKREFACEVCGMKLVGNQAVLNHKISHEKFTCGICNKEFSKSSRSKHMKKCMNDSPILCCSEWPQNGAKNWDS